MALQFPILRLRAPTFEPRSKASYGRGKLHVPARPQQVARLTPQFGALESAIANRRAELQQTAAGAEPELVLVLEIAGSVEAFIRAVRRVPELEWLAEIE